MILVSRLSPSNDCDFLFFCLDPLFPNMSAIIADENGFALLSEHDDYYSVDQLR